MSKPFTCPPLPYPLESLEPVMSRKLVQSHYDTRTKGYYAKVSELVKGTIFEDASSLRRLLTREALVQSDSKLFNQAAQAYNHTFFWQGLCPADNSSVADAPELLQQIAADFESFEAMKDELIEKSMQHFGSGWVWIVYKNNKLSIKATPNAQNPLRDAGTVPLLVIDLWEHAHELDYPADREKYLTQCFNIINWKQINARFLETSND